MKNVGIDIGSTTVKVVVMEGEKILYRIYQRHLSQVRQATLKALEGAKQFLNDTFQVAISGSAGLGLAEDAGVDFVQEVFATYKTVMEYEPDTDAVIELGGEDAKIIFLSGGLEERMNGSCAGGTGAFIDQMATLLNVTTEELDELKTADLIVSSCNAKMPEQMAAVQALPAVFAYDFGEKEKYRTNAYYDEVCHGIDLAMLSCKPMDRAAFAELCAPLHRRGVVHVLATMGAAGQMLSVQGKIVEKTTQMVEASDTMGAGDSFLAAFLCSLYTAGWQKAKPMPEQALLAALAAGQQVSARNCMAQGGFGCKAEISRDSIE